MLLHDRRGVEVLEVDKEGQDPLSDGDNEKGSGRKAATQKELSKELFPSATKSPRSDTTSTLSPSDPFESAILATLKPPPSPKGEEKELLLERQRFELKRDQLRLEQEVEDARAKRKERGEQRCECSSGDTVARLLREDDGVCFRKVKQVGIYKL